MSFWIYGKKKDGRRNLYSISANLQVLVPLLLVLVLAIVRGLRGCAH